VPLLAASNTFTGNQTVNGHLSATGFVSGSSYLIGSTLFAFGSDSAGNAFLGFAGNTTTTGIYNTATGYNSLTKNSTGNDNTADGVGALAQNGTGSQNTAVGFAALTGNFGSFNTATGNGALSGNGIGSYNTAVGNSALSLSGLGNYNTAVGNVALGNNQTGNYDIGIGNSAGALAPAGNSNSIYIGSEGSGSDHGGVIYLGTQGTQTGGTYIAGISGASVANGAPVYVNSNGQLGTVLSSGRFKEQIADMGDASDKLLQLRPVTFFYKPEYDDGSHLPQYGLIAEEVAKIFPEMVAYDKDGQILTVKYQLLAPMLLNEVQKQNETIRQLQDRLAALEALLGKSGQ